MATCAIGGVGERPAARDRLHGWLGLGPAKTERTAQNQGRENRPHSVLRSLHRSISRWRQYSAKKRQRARYVVSWRRFAATQPENRRRSRQHEIAFCCLGSPHPRFVMRAVRKPT